MMNLWRRTDEGEDAVGFRTAFPKATAAAAAVGLAIGFGACGEDKNGGAVGEATSTSTATEPATERTTPSQTSTSERTTTTPPKTSTSPGGEPTKASQSKSKRCTPKSLDLAVPSGVKIETAGAELSVQLSRLRLGSGTVKIVIQRAVSQRKIKSLQVRGKTISAPGTTYHGVIVKITNDGKKAISPATVGSAFRLRAGSKSYVLSDVVPTCAGVSTSLAGSQSLPTAVRGKVAPTQAAIAPGADSTTVFVFAVVNGAKPKTLFSPRLKVAGQVPS